jgi:hypothetical protein
LLISVYIEFSLLSREISLGWVFFVFFGVKAHHPGSWGAAISPAPAALGQNAGAIRESVLLRHYEKLDKKL